MTPADHQLLHSAAHALSTQPFAAKLTVCGITHPRAQLRQIERDLLRQRTAERKAA